jgi:hypothetical protein
MNVASSLNFGDFDFSLAQVPPKAHKELKQVINVGIFAKFDFNHFQIITLERHQVLAFQSYLSPLGPCSPPL